MKLSRKIYIFLIIVLILLAGFIILNYTMKRPASRALNEFLDSLNDSSNISLHDYIVPGLINDPFLTTLMDQNIVLSHRIIKTQKYDDGIKIKTTLSTKHGPIEVWFHLSKVDNRWLITQLPRTAYIPAAVPILAEDKDNQSIEYQMDVNGTYLYCTFPSRYSQINIGVPIYLILIEDYIVVYQHMTPIRLEKVVSASESHIEDYNLGYIPIESDFAIYEVTDNKSIFQKTHILPIGITNVILYRSETLNNKSLVAYIDKTQMPNNKIRVVLNDTQFQNLSHQEVRLSSTKGLTVHNQVDSIEYKIEGDDEVVFKYDDDNGSQLYHNGNLIGSSSHRWYITPENGGKLIVNSIKRSQTQNQLGTPYRGDMEVSSYSSGLVLINEVDLESYLYSVVPSEMPIKFGLESLKVQAIAARSYAVRCLESTGYASLGAHVDDSTSSQMYNNIQEYSIAIEAVEQTRGLVPVYEDKIIDARFFSTSCGYTANFNETWSKDDLFPSTQVPYLVAKPQFPGDAASLHNEENFRAFIKQKDTQSYDQYSPFYRWSLTMKSEQVEAILQENLSNLQKKQPAFILTRGKDGSFIQQSIPEEIGQLQNITPISRGQGGNIMELEITTTSGIYRIIKELNIRQLLKPINLIPDESPIEIKRYDGSVVKDFPILPSSFFYMDVIRDSNGNISHVVFDGGGYGHGVGMSQYGAYGLSLLGKSYKEIIEHYYPGTVLYNLY